MEKQTETLIASSTSTSGLNSSNIGFQLLKKHGWKEGSGLGISQQGRLEPVETYVKNNKRGLGADKISATTSIRPSRNNQATEKKTKKEKAMSKRMKKMQDEEKSWQDKEFERSFFREFWPDNV